MSVDPEALLAQDAAIDAAVKQRTRYLTSENKRLSGELKELAKLVRFYDLARHERIRVPAWRRSTGRAGQHVGTVMAQMADWHLDEVVNPAEVLGLGKYNREIARRRAGLWAEKVVTLPREYMRGLDIKGLVIPATGDLFTGYIHDELEQTNEDVVLGSFLHWMEPIIGMLEMLGTEYPGVELDAVVGNHGRLTKPHYKHKGRVKDNLEWLFWSLVRDRLADRGKAPNVVVNVSSSSNMHLSVYGRNYVLDHGYEFKGGSGISGAYSPLSLGKHRKNLREVVAGRPMHTMIVGHMHQLINIQGVIMGGSLKGYDEYAFDLNLVPDDEGAGQAMWVTSPEHAQVLWMPIYVQDRKAEGW